jgi:hypothetical protein
MVAKYPWTECFGESGITITPRKSGVRRVDGGKNQQFN